MSEPEADLTSLPEAIRTEFAGIVGEAQLTADVAQREQLAIDGKVPDFVVYPKSAEHVAQTLKYAADHNVAVVACGGATGLGTGSAPQRYDVALCMRNISNVSYYEPSDLTAGVGAGMRLTDFQNLLYRNGLWLPLDPPGNERATIGGIVATNASGPLRQFYGAPRDMVVGMQVATTDGKLVKTGGRVVKNVAGYDLGKLMIGSYGTLGIITQVNLKLFPLPAERRTFILSTGTLGIARDLRRSILNSPIAPLRMVLLDAEAAGMACSVCTMDHVDHEPQVWLEAGGSKAVIDRTAKDLDGLGRAVGAKIRTFEVDSVQAAWLVISDFINWLDKTYPGAFVMKGTMPIASSEEFLSLAQQEAQNEKVRMVSVTQSGVGILHLGLLGSSNVGQTVSLIGRIRKAAEKVGGALILISAPTPAKGKVDVWGTPGSGFELMRKMKSVWDPKRILAPGRFLGSI